MAYKPNYATGDLIDVTIWQELVNRAIYIFADSTARDDASTGITSPTEGQFCYLLDTGGGSGGLQYYDGSSWSNTSLTADITGIVTNANSGLAGGTTSGDATLTVDANNLDTATAVSTDYVVIEDVTDNSTKKALISDIISQGDITEVNTSGTSGLSGGATSGAVNLSLDPSSLTDGTSSLTVDLANDLLVIEDVTDGTVYKINPADFGFATNGDAIALAIAL